MPFPNKATQFGQPCGNKRAIAPRRGVRVGKQRIKELQRALIVSRALAEIAGENDKPFEGDALSLFKQVYSDRSLPLELRLAAARHACQFERPTLAAVATRDVGPARATLEDLLIEKSRLAEERGLALTNKPLLEGRADAVVYADEHA